MVNETDLNEALDVLRDYESDALVAAKLVARRGSASLLAEAEPDLARPITEGETLKALRTVADSISETGATRQLWRRYPATCAFYMIDVGRREYGSGGLYPRIAEELGLECEQLVNRWADGFVAFLDSLKLQRFMYTSAAKYKLESILLHGGLPNDAWLQVWEHWILPGVQRAGFRDSRSLIEWALSSAHDAPVLRTTTRDILRNGGLLVEKLISQAIQAATDSQVKGFVDSSTQYQLPAAALTSLEQVLGAPRLRWPELRFDLGAASMVFFDIPEIDLGHQGASSRTSMRYDLFDSGARVASIGHDETVAQRLSSTWKMQGFRMPARPVSGYQMLIHLDQVGHPPIDSEKRMRWRADERGIWVFRADRKGRWVCLPEHSWKSLSGDITYLLPPGLRLTADDGCRVLQEASLDGDWGGWTACHITGGGGRVTLVANDDGITETWRVGQKCSVHLDNESRVTVGHLILDRSIPVYGCGLPDAVVEPLDPMVDLVPDQWSCWVSWGPTSQRVTVPVPLVLEEPGHRLRGAVDQALAGMPQVVNDGEIRIVGPKGHGCLARRFAHVPFGRPVLHRLAWVGGGLLQAEYDIESGIDLSRQVTGSEVEVSRRGSMQTLTAPLSVEAIPACVSDAGKKISMNIDLIGLSLEAEGIDLPRDGTPLCVPRAALVQMAGAVLRLALVHKGACIAQLVLYSPGGEPVVLREVGTSAHLTDALGFGELARSVPRGLDASLALVVKAGSNELELPLLEIPSGLGIGQPRLVRSDKGSSVICDHAAAVPIDVALVDVTAPWRDHARGSLLVGDSAARLHPEDFAFPLGRYGVWMQVADEWAASLDLSVEPTLVVDVTDADQPDAPPIMGPYHSGLAQLLQYQAGLVARPPLGSPTQVPRMHMLEQDAEATVSTLLHRLRPMGVEIPGVDPTHGSAATLGGEIMSLKDYRYPLSPAVVRRLIQAGSDGWRPVDVMSAAACMRLPLVAVRVQSCAYFDPEELDDAWRLHPYVGLLVSLLHSGAGRSQEARDGVSRWLECHSGKSVQKLLQELRVDATVIRKATQGELTHPQDCTLSTRACLEWLGSTTLKEQVKTAQWVRECVRPVRHAISQFRPVAGPLSSLISCVEARDCGEDVKTISNVPFVCGTLAVAALAVLTGHTAASPFVAAVLDGRSDDPAHQLLTEKLMVGLELCPEVLGMEFFLTRLWWSLESEEL